MFLKFPGDIHSWGNTLDPLGLNFSNHFIEVPSEELDHDHGAGLAEGSVRAIIGEVVRHLWRRNPEIGERVFCIHIAEILAIGNDWKARNPGCIESSSQDDDINFLLLPLWVDKAFLGDRFQFST